MKRKYNRIILSDSGYAGLHTDISGANTDWSPWRHGTGIVDLIKTYSPDANIYVHQVPEEFNLSREKMLEHVTELKDMAQPDDLIVIEWVVHRDPDIDRIVSRIAEKSDTLICAGNFGDTIENWSPATVSEAQTISCWNKSNQLAKLSNYGDKCIPMYGTSVTMSDGTISSGTSASTAIMAGILWRNTSEKFLRRVMYKMRLYHEWELQS